MFAQFFTVAFVVLLGAMQPGPNFAIVTRNSLLHSRCSGLFTSLGVSCAIAVHMSYCVLGLAWVISESLFLFNLIKYAGAAYLIYLGIHSILTPPLPLITPDKKATPSSLSNTYSFRQGFFGNLLNPEATLFFLALFTALIKPNTAFTLQLLYVSEIILIPLLWYSSLTIILSHPRVKRLLEKSEKYLSKLLGLFLISFGLALILINK